MLAVDPARRISIAQIRQHRWMQAGPAPPGVGPAGPTLSCSSSLGGYDEQVLGFMQTLGVDRQRTVEVGTALGFDGEAWGGGAALGREALASPVPVGAWANLRASFSKRYSRLPKNNPGDGLVRGPQGLETPEARPLRCPLAGAGADLLPRASQSLQNSSYNHFAAIYYLLLERLRGPRGSPPSARAGPALQQRPRGAGHSAMEVSGSPSKACPVPALDRVPGVGVPRLDVHSEMRAEATGPRSHPPAH